MLKKCASRIYMVLIFAFLYLPIVVLIVPRLNGEASRSGGIPAVFRTKRL